MARIRLKQLPALTSYERISLLCSIAALVIALFAAVLSPLATYYWFDPATKEYTERGMLLRSAGENVSEYSYYTENYTSPRWDIGTVDTLVNAGRRPIKSIELYLGMKAGAGNSIELSVDNRVVEKVKEASHYTVFGVSGALAPGDTIVVRFRGSRDAGLFVLTEHGDRLELLARPRSQREVVSPGLAPSRGVK